MCAGKEAALKVGGQGGLHPEDTVPGWDDTGGLRADRFRCPSGCPGAQATRQPVPGEFQFQAATGS